jgi:formylglycine-generating enzyme required for sulfatase activity
MALIPGGEFLMGSSLEETRDAREFCERTVGQDCKEEFFQREPQRLVRVSPFYLDTTEVSNEEFAAWLNHQPGLQSEGPHRVNDPRSVLLVDLYPSDSGGLERQGGRIIPRPGRKSRPVVQVTWEAALRYCQAQGKRLPTEAEWEFAARGPEGHRFPWGDGEPRCDGVVFGRKAGRACAHLGPGPGPVGNAEQDRSPHGIFDLGGNVSEWVMDLFRMPYLPCRAACIDPLIDTPVLGESVMRVVRGGNWFMPAESCRAAGRNRWPPDKASGNIGFRCARPSKEARHP